MPNLFDQESPNPVIPSEDQVPAYLVAADNHNLGNTRGGSWFSPDTWADKFSNTGSFAAVSILSGANSFYNTGVTIANWLGAEAESNDTKEWISGIDSDLGSYYDKNRSAADLVGFIAGSLIPGVGGVKVLNAGQAALKAASRGMIGTNISRATGLLVPATERYVSLAARDINAATATFNAINANGIKALASGVWQNTLESAAFETAVQATMFKSPILSDQDGWDIVKNIAIGGVVGGVIGGAFQGASTLGKIKTAVKEFELGGKWASSIEQPAAALNAGEKIILLAEQKDFSAVPRILGPDATESEKLAFSADTKAYTDKVRRIENEQRTLVHSIVKGNDSELGNMVADSVQGLDHRTMLSNFLHADEITRVGTSTKVEDAIRALIKEGKPISPNLQVSYVKLTGEGAGEVSADAPTILNLADKVTVKGSRATKDAILDHVRAEKFKPEVVWDPLHISKNSGHLEAESRYLWAHEILKEIKPGTKLSQNDIPLLERAYKDGVLDLKLVDPSGAVIKDSFSSREELYRHIIATKEKVANQLLLRNVYKAKNNLDSEFATQAISKIVNTRLGRLEGTQLTAETRDYFAWQSGVDDYREFLRAKGLETPASKEADPRFLPTYAKISRVAEDLQDAGGHVMDGITWIKSKQAAIQGDVNRVVAKATGDLYGIIPEVPDNVALTANRYGAGATLFGHANGGYGTLESYMQQTGSAAKSLMEKFRKTTGDTHTSALHALGNKQEAAIEFETVNQKITRSAKLWVLDEEAAANGEYRIITKEARDEASKASASGMEFDIPEEAIIKIQNPETWNTWKSLNARTSSRTTTLTELHATQGKTNVRDPSVIRPIRQSPTDYPYIAFVKDPRVTGQGHTSMIFANDEAKLQELINKVPSFYKTVTKRDSEDFFRARNEYEYQRTLHESYIDSDLKNRGIYSNFFSKTDPQKIINDVLQQELREDDILARELIRTKNQRLFDWLEDQGDAYTKVAASKLGSFSERLEKSGKNPYLDYIKTALNISKANEYPLIHGFNKFLDSAVSKAVGHVNDLFSKSKTPAELDKINSLLDHYGMNTGYRDAALDLLSNHSAPRGELTKFVRTANAVLSKLTLGLDPFNALNNAIGANILRGTELKQITDAIKSGDSNLAGALGELSKVTLPGVRDQITSPAKVISKAIQNFFQDDGKLLNQYKTLGIIKNSTEQFKSIMDDFTLKGTETVGELNSRLTRAIEKTKALSELGEKYSGNKLAEEFNRFISADVIRQITDLGVSSNLLTRSEQAAYINTFVNRVEGNIIASQRPLMFQGPIGQAIGLFQSYQFNLMQQLFRYVGEGTKKDAAMLLGLQGTFYGLQGLPAFQFVNQHIVGTLSGNTQHRDLYDATYGVAGKEIGDLLIYGLPSNLLQANLYSRGDINPRQVTVIPTSIPDVPFVGAFGKFLGSIKDAVSKIGAGGNVWESMLQGLEHNGLSRPMSGFAQTLQGLGAGGSPYSTTSGGSILFSNDLMSWATMTRLAGARPLDEAIINDGVFRIQSYKQYDLNKRLELSGAIKSATINGNIPDEQQYIKFAKLYAESGGKQMGFNQFMLHEYKAANTSQSQKILGQLNNPFAQKMQLLMGGSQDQ